MENSIIAPEPNQGFEGPASFEEAHRTYRPLVYRIIGQVLASSRIPCPQAIIDDIAQEVWIRLLRFFDRFDPQRGVKFSTWLGQIAKNATYDYVRTVARRQSGREFISFDDFELPDTSSTGDPQGIAEVHEFLDELDKRVAELSASLQHTFLLHVQGCSTDEIMARRGIKRPTVNTQRFKARAALRATLSRP